MSLSDLSGFEGRAELLFHITCGDPGVLASAGFEYPSIFLHTHTRTAAGFGTWRAGAGVGEGAQA